MWESSKKRKLNNAATSDKSIDKKDKKRSKKSLQPYYSLYYTKLNMKINNLNTLNKSPRKRDVSEMSRNDTSTGEVKEDNSLRNQPPTEYIPQITISRLAKAKLMSHSLTNQKKQTTYATKSKPTGKLVGQEGKKSVITITKISKEVDKNDKPEDVGRTRSETKKLQKQIFKKVLIPVESEEKSDKTSAVEQSKKISTGEEKEVCASTSKPLDKETSKPVPSTSKEGEEDDGKLEDTMKTRSAAKKFQKQLVKKIIFPIESEKKLDSSTKDKTPAEEQSKTSKEDTTCKEKEVSLCASNPKPLDKEISKPVKSVPSTSREEQKDDNLEDTVKTRSAARKFQKLLVKKTLIPVESDKKSDSSTKDKTHAEEQSKKTSKEDATCEEKEVPLCASNPKPLDKEIIKPVTSVPSTSREEQKDDNLEDTVKTRSAAKKFQKLLVKKPVFPVESEEKTDSSTKAKTLVEEESKKTTSQTLTILTDETFLMCPYCDKSFNKIINYNFHVKCHLQMRN